MLFERLRTQRLNADRNLLDAFFAFGGGNDDFIRIGPVGIARRCGLGEDGLNQCDDGTGQEEKANTTQFGNWHNTNPLRNSCAMIANCPGMGQSPIGLRSRIEVFLLQNVTKTSLLYDGCFVTYIPKFWLKINRFNKNSWPVNSPPSKADLLFKNFVPASAVILL